MLKVTQARLYLNCPKCETLFVFKLGRDLTSNIEATCGTCGAEFNLTLDVQQSVDVEKKPLSKLAQSQAKTASKTGLVSKKEKVRPEGSVKRRKISQPQVGEDLTRKVVKDG